MTASVFTNLLLPLTTPEAWRWKLGIGAGGSTAADVGVTPGGGISSTDVQDALEELDAEKVDIAGDTMTGPLVLPGAPTAPNEAATKAYVDSVAGGGGLALATTTEVLTGTDATKAVTPDALAALWEGGKGATPAATFAIGEGGFYSLNGGTATVTAITFTIPTPGRIVWFRVQPSAAGTILTHNSTSLALPAGGANITLGSNDCFALTLTSAGFYRVIAFTRGDGSPLAADATKQPLDATLTALAAFATNGIVTQIAADTFAGRTIVGGTGITVTNGDGVSGNPSIAVTASTYAPIAHTHPQSDVTSLVADLALKAPLASPALTGTPVAPTAAPATATTQIATTAFVGAAVTAAAVPSPATVAPLMDGVAAVGTTTKYAREDHKHPTDTTREATIAAGTTAQYWRGDKSFQILDKAAVGLANVDNTSDASKPVSTVQQAAIDLKANIASPTFTGDPKAPTPTAGDNDTSIATTAFVSSAIAASGGNPPASTTEVLTGTATNRDVTPDALAALWEKGANVASAGTVSLGEGGYFHITGTTTITDIDWATAKDGRAAWVIFDGALTLTHNATTLILPGGANITTAAGDRACFVQDASDNVTCVSYERADGRPVTPHQGFRNLLINGDGRVNQRGTAGASSADDTYAVDRWYTLSQTAAIYMQPTVDIEAGSPFTINLAQIQVASQFFGMAQIIEGKNCKHLRGQPVTLSGRLGPTTAFNIKYAILEWTGTEDAPVSDVVNNWASTNYTVNNFFINNASLTVRAVGTFAANVGMSAMTPLTTTLGTTFNNLIIMIWKETIGAQNQGFIGKYQLEEGAVATPYEYRPYGVDLALCQRYYAVLAGVLNVPYVAGYNTAGSVVGATLKTPVTMRIAPTTVKNGTWGVVNCGQPVIAGSSVDAVSYYVTVTATGPMYSLADSADDTITCSAEL